MRLQLIVASFCLTRALYHVELSRISGRFGYRVTRELDLANADVELAQAQLLLEVARTEAIA